MSSDLRIDLRRQGFRDVMQCAGVRQLLAYEGARVKGRAESVSGLRFGVHVTTSGRYVSAVARVGASSVNSKTGRFNAGLHKRQVAALEQALHGV